ncbi:hypothetical protein [Lacrimispora sphenoides]|uniref:hypothetical protein n=1 Tax=Lacrimispora sphenoides TaxID=29370 RepID=UPI00115FC7C6|nr:hypothetical protein [Lacrimispora sphenoides]
MLKRTGMHDVKNARIRKEINIFQSICHKREEVGNACKYDSASFAELESAVTRAEKAMKEQRWIPISERLPTVQDISDNMCPCFLTTEKYQSTAQRRTFNIITGEFKDSTGRRVEVLAWMPLPRIHQSN